METAGPSTMERDMDLNAMQRFVDQQVKEKVSENMRLGQMVAMLGTCRPDSTVSYDFGGFVPTGPDSYRGYYNHLSFGYAEYAQDKEVTVAALIEWCREASGKTLTGYKGGEFKMDDNTPLWAANYGQSHGTAITGIGDYGYHVKILTGYVD